MPMNIKDSIPEYTKTGLLALELVLLIIRWAPSKSTQPILSVLRYVFLAASL